jgi:hypothetical protein
LEGHVRKLDWIVNYWCEVRALYSPLFASEIDGLLPPQN